MRTFLQVISGIIIGAVIAGISFVAGVAYGVEETSKIACEGICAVMSELDIDETSDELILGGYRYGECEGMRYVMTRTK